MISILLIEDDKIFRKSIKDLLFEFGYTILEAGDAAEALALYRANRPHLIISEIMMPKINGFDFLEEMNNGLHADSVPMLLLSESVDNEIIRKADRLGAREVISKPCKMRDLLQRVMDYTSI